MIAQVTYYDVASLDKLLAWLEDDAVYKVDEVSQRVHHEPVRDGAGCVVGKTQAGCHEPRVVVEGQRHQAQPGNVAAVWRRWDLVEEEEEKERFTVLDSWYIGCLILYIGKTLAFH